MKAIILAAGRGSRMGQHTEEQPKCLTMLAGRTLLDWQIDALRAAGIEDIVVVRGYQKEKLPGDGYRVVDNPRWEKTNMVMSLACAQSMLLEGPCVISYSDIVYHPSAVKGLVGAQGDIGLTYDVDWKRLWADRFDDPLSDAETFVVQSGRLVEIGQRTADIDEIQGQYMGLVKFEPHGWQQVQELLAALTDEQKARLDMTALLAQLLHRGSAITTVPVQGRWCEVDSGADLSLYEQKLAGCENGAQWPHDWRW